MMKKIALFAAVTMLTACDAGRHHHEETGEAVSMVSSDNSKGWRRGRAVLGADTAHTVVAVAATPYHDPMANAEMSLSSTSASDTGDVTVVYLGCPDAPGPTTKTYALNGTSYVPTGDSDLCLIERMYMADTNIGTIRLHATASGGDIVASIGVDTYGNGLGDAQTLSLRHYVPDGKESKISAISVNATGPTEWTLRARPLDDPESSYTVWSDYGVTFDLEFNNPFTIPPRTRLVLFAEGDGDYYVLDAAMHYKDEDAN